MASLMRTTAARPLSRTSILVPRCSSRIVGVSQRHITNATKIDYVPSLHNAPRAEEKPGGWSPTLIHSSGDSTFKVIRLNPGDGEVPIHYHNKVWDYFLPIEGEAVIETETKDGVKKDYEMKPGSFLAVPPEDTHRVRNKLKDKEFVFFIIQSPRQQYDFIAR